MNQNQTQQTKSLAVIDGETLMEQRLKPTGFCVETLLPQRSLHPCRRTQTRQILAGTRPLSAHRKGRTALESANETRNNPLPLSGRQPSPHPGTAELPDR